MAALLVSMGLAIMMPAPFWAQEGAPPPPPSEKQTIKPEEKPPAESITHEVLTPAEKDRIRRAGNLSAQMKVFTDITQQYVNAMREAAGQEQVDRLQAAAASLAEVYRLAESHVRQSPERKKQKHLKKYEISLREQISLLKSLQSLSPYGLRDIFTAPIEAGEHARKSAISIIFEGGNVKKS